MSRSATAFLAALAIGLTASCAATTQQGSSGRSRNVLTAEDLQGQSERNLYDLLARMRPNWIRPQGAVLATGTTPVLVYVNNVRMGGVAVLADIRLDEVEQVRFVDAIDATTRYGMNTDGGVIEVTTKRGPL
ncbi:MAG: TonB-dependent receptor plug domain-containing protein [Gemmatimonadota bacterium]|nr:MAG: TonB-dependent receptor plug domain-containing protein [Gemmatimonadota bacterium]